MYRRVLLEGCRCIEVDICDGADGEPEVTHVHALTSRVKFLDVLRAIDEAAFASSPLPVLISVEMHCSSDQQKKCARYMRSVFGDKLLLPDDLSKLGGAAAAVLSPEALAGRILVKGKPANDVPRKGSVESSGERSARGLRRSSVARVGSLRASVLLSGARHDSVDSTLGALKIDYERTSVKTDLLPLRCSALGGTFGELPAAVKPEVLHLRGSLGLSEARRSVSAAARHGSLGARQSEDANAGSLSSRVSRVSATTPLGFGSATRHAHVSITLPPTPTHHAHGGMPRARGSRDERPLGAAEVIFLARGSLRETTALSSARASLVPSLEARLTDPRALQLPRDSRGTASASYSGPHAASAASSPALGAPPAAHQWHCRRPSLLRVTARALLRKVSTPVELAKRQKGTPRYVDPEMLRITAVRSCALYQAPTVAWPLPIVSVGEDRMLAVEQDGLDGAEAPHVLFGRRLCRVYPAGTRVTSENMDPLPCWRLGAQMVSLNYQSNDLPTQLSRALFSLGGGLGYVLKPPELRGVAGEEWPPFRHNLRRYTLRVLSLNCLPTRREHRPAFGSAAHHAFERGLSGHPSPPDPTGAIHHPLIAVELHAVGGFCAVSKTLPLPARPVQRLTVPASGSRGRTLHCLAAEPKQTLLRVSVHDGETLVAYEALVLGVLRPGYRCIQLRSRCGTPIHLCSLLVHIEAGEEPNCWAEARALRSALAEREARIHALSAELAAAKTVAVRNGWASLVGESGEDLDAVEGGEGGGGALAPLLPRDEAAVGV